jgi:hypothetical protein
MVARLSARAKGAASDASLAQKPQAQKEKAPPVPRGGAVFENGDAILVDYQDYH